jgi:hypothetical protein
MRIEAVGRSKSARQGWRLDQVTSKVLVARLWDLYSWPERNLPMREMTIAKLLTYRAQPDYVSDAERTRKPPPRAWDYGRIRHFYEGLLAGEALDAIEVDNVCNFGWIYPEPVLLDGHHCLAASHLAGVRVILANYGGRIDLLRYSVVRLTDVSIDDLLVGALLSPRTCPHCGHPPPDDFVDEETVVEDRPREVVLRLVK